MRHMICLGLLAAPLLLASASRAGSGAGALINGKDLEGFEGLIAEHWKWDAQQKAIVGSAPQGLKFNTFLVSKRKYGDFEMSFQVKMTAGANSGVQIRSEVENTKT